MKLSLNKDDPVKTELEESSEKRDGWLRGDNIFR